MTPDYTSLAAFRHSIRRFLKAGDAALTDANLEPQQYQLLLAVKARQVNGDEAAIRDLADALLLTHHACVGLVDRLERRGFVTRARSHVDARRVRIELTEAGEAAVERLAAVHQAQLQLLGPGLLSALGAIVESITLQEAAH